MLEAQRFDVGELLRMEVAVADPAMTEVKRDRWRSDMQAHEIRKDARPARDQAIFALRIGWGLRVQTVANITPTSSTSSTGPSGCARSGRT